MRNILLTIGIGLCAGFIDILPMLKLKKDINSILSAFAFYFIAPFIILSSDLFDLPWWLKGGIILPVLAIPNMLVIMKKEKEAIPVIILMSIIIGTLIGIIGHLLKLAL